MSELDQNTSNENLESQETASQPQNDFGVTVAGFYQGQKVWVLRKDDLLKTTVTGVTQTFERTTVNVAGLRRAVDASVVFTTEESARNAFFNSRVSTVD